MVKRLLVLLLLAPSIFHAVFHLFDWIVWGLDLPSLMPRTLLQPFFAGTGTLPLAVHATVNLGALAAFVWLFILVSATRAG